MTESFAEVVSRLGAAQKGRARGAPAYSVYVNRPVGRVLAAFAYRAGLTPNQVTLVSAAFTAAALLLLMLVPPSVPLGIGVWLLLALGYGWDSADGQVARLRGGGSLAGEWLDHMVDACKVACLHAAVLIALARFVEPPRVWMLVAIAFGIVSSVTFFGMILNDLLKSKAGAPSAIARGGGSALRSLVLLPTDYGFLCAIFAFWGFPAVFLPVYAAVFVASALFLVVASVKWFRDIRAVDAGA